MHMIPPEYGMYTMELLMGACLSGNDIHNL